MEGVELTPASLDPVYDPEADEREYCRALLDEDELAALKASVAVSGYYTVESVRGLIRQNCVKESSSAAGDNCVVDPELMVILDTHINYSVFIAGDNVYTRDELFAHYPFEAFGTTPESVFAQQEVGVFPADGGGAPHELVARDVGDPDEFIMVEDLVKNAARPGAEGGRRRRPARVVKTKIFLGKDRWADFSLMKRFVQSFAQFAPALACTSKDGHALPWFMGSAPLQIQEAETAVERRSRALEEKAAALRVKEEELKSREDRLSLPQGLSPPTATFEGRPAAPTPSGRSAGGASQDGHIGSSLESPTAPPADEPTDTVEL